MKLWSVQVLRFVAAVLVVHVHATTSVSIRTGEPSLLGPLALIIGHAGVDLFFVISGLIITLTARGMTAGDFLARRARRIFPIYWLAALPWIAIAAAGGALGWRELLASVALWPATDRIVAPALGVGWTLCFEVLFYAAAGLVLWRRWTAWPLAIGYVAALFIGRGPVLDFVGNPLVLEFLFGVALAFAPRWKPAILALPIGLAALVVLAPYAQVQGLDTDYLRGVGNWSRVAAFGCPAALIVWGTTQVDAHPGALTQLGDASYSIYLFHVPMVLVTGGLLNRFTNVPTDLVVALCVVVAVVIGWRIHVLFERPILAFLSRGPKAALAT